MKKYNCKKDEGVVRVVRLEEALIRPHSENGVLTHLLLPNEEQPSVTRVPEGKTCK